MAKAKKLPSGSWSCLAYSHTEMVDDKKKRIYERFTASTRKEAEFLAAEFQINKKHRNNRETITVAQAIENYIDSKSNILSPATIRSYRSLQRNHFHEIGKLPLHRITRMDVQKEFNTYAATLSPKTVRNLHGLFSAAISVYIPEFRLKTSLPAKERKEMKIPTELEIRSLLSFSEGTPMYLPILFAFSMGLRRGEISGLKWKDVDTKRKILMVRTSVVLDENKKWVEKPPKSFSGNRVLDIPEFVAEILAGLARGKKSNEHVVNLMPSEITNKFISITRHIGLRRIRFHDLRHYYASMMLANNIPDKYAMKRMGHATNSMLKTVYQHTMETKDQEVTATINAYFSQYFS